METRNSKSKALDNMFKSRIIQDAPQHLRNSFLGRGRGRGRSSHDQGGQFSQDDRSGVQGSRASRRLGYCKACGKLGHWAQDCRTNLPTIAAPLPTATL